MLASILLTGMVAWQVEREVRLHASLQHDHIIQLYGAFEDDRHVYLAQEFATGELNLSQYQKTTFCQLRRTRSAPLSIWRKL